jgi:hypothetical protein
MADSIPETPEEAKRPFRPIAAYNFIIGLMLACLMFVIVTLARRIFPAWNGNSPRVFHGNTLL